MKNSDPYRILTRYYNSQPFRIVIEYYDIECANLYEVVKSLFKYPGIQEDDTLESFIYASAFAYICRDFLNREEHKDLHGNFIFLLNEMNYDEDDIKLLKQRLSTETLGIDPKFYGELIWAVINDYKKIINNDLKKLLKTNENIENFMGSTLGFNDMDSSIQIPSEM
ncbi:hypothetical protein FFWV33_15925 [Flavobacterium faecale]|uniref:Uncharacterized protein n=1 Tax=Flavobacterium faecale TaxID=1355330 RepID=A0A2S1LGP4_9FLAO|nr:hypothetical protein [Flavobacterium faecale]AWG22907.1 hypothetical protein FFWV33_15925 [Flavobacterium faecale]